MRDRILFEIENQTELFAYLSQVVSSKKDERSQPASRWLAAYMAGMDVSAEYIKIGSDWVFGLRAEGRTIAVFAAE